jgi:hypothetical protein
MQACYAVASLAEFRAQAGEEYQRYQVIAIDEAQFLPDLLAFCTRAADVDGKHILLAGLDGDFQRARFGQVGTLAWSCPAPVPPPENHSVGMNAVCAALPAPPAALSCASRSKVIAAPLGVHVC